MAREYNNGRLTSHLRDAIERVSTERLQSEDQPRHRMKAIIFATVHAELIEFEQIITTPGKLFQLMDVTAQQAAQTQYLGCASEDYVILCIKLYTFALSLFDWTRDAPKTYNVVHHIGKKHQCDAIKAILDAKKIV